MNEHKQVQEVKSKTIVSYNTKTFHKLQIHFKRQNRLNLSLLQISCSAVCVSLQLLGSKTNRKQQLCFMCLKTQQS